jgi:hypothetical protein
LYEWMLFYDYPTLVLVTLSALFFVRMIDEPTLGRSAAFFASTATLTLTRTIFHPLWFVAPARPGVRGRARPAPDARAVAAAVPLAAVALIVGKNVVQFGVPGTSSWLGLGLRPPRPATTSPAAIWRRLVSEGRVDRVALVEPLRRRPWRRIGRWCRRTDLRGTRFSTSVGWTSGNPNFFNPRLRRPSPGTTSRGSRV